MSVLLSHHQRRLLPLILSSLFCSAHAATELAPVMVTASRVEEDVAARLSDVTVIERDDLERAGAASIADVLQFQHGVSTNTSGGPQSTASIFIRGSNPAHTLILIDGQRIGSSTAGGASLNALALSQVERIEIVRGPASSLYGADAMGGVINIITRRGQGPLQATATAGAGSRGVRVANAGLSGSKAGFSYAVNLGHESADGASSRSRPDPTNSWDAWDPDRDGFRRSSGSVQLGWDWAPGHSVKAQALYSEVNGQYDGVPGMDDREIARVSAVALTTRDQLCANWISQFRLGRTVDDSTSVYGGVDYRYRTRQLQAGWQNELNLGAGGHLTLAWDHVDEGIDADYTTGGVPDSRTTDSLLAVYRLQVERHHLQLSARRDHSNQYADENTGSLQYGFDLLPTVRFVASIGNAFRAPTFNDLYYPGYGQPGILPERSISREAGFQINGKGFGGSLVAWHNRVSNLIAYQYPCATPGYDFGCAANVAHARLQGLSVSWRQVWGDTSAKWSYDLLDARDADTGLQLARRPHRQGSLQVTQLISDWTLGGEALGASRRYDDSSNRQELAGYGVLNLFVGWRLNTDWSVLARVNNVADHDYEVARFYGTERRSLFVALSYGGQ